MSYEVRISDEIENTGLDGEFFATREEAEQAAGFIRSEFSEICARVDPCVCESDEEPTLTYDDWFAAGW